MKYVFTHSYQPSMEEKYDSIIKMRKDIKISNTEYLLTFPLKLFIKYCYAALTPNESGFKIAKYMIFQSNMVEIPQSYNCGDAFLIHAGEEKNAEIKVSFLSEKKLFTVRNIRPWQNIHYYILCFIKDPNSDPDFFCVNLHDLLRKFHPSYMAGTISDNTLNKRSNLGLTIPYTYENMRYLENINLLESTSFESLCQFSGYDSTEAA